MSKPQRRYTKKDNKSRNDFNEDYSSKRSKYRDEPKYNIHVQPKTENQKQYVKALRDSVLTIVTAPPGCAKSYLAAAVACQDLVERRVEKIIITRAAASTSRGLGFMPGDSNEKCQHWYVSILSYMKEMLSPNLVDLHVKRGNIILAPMETMMGRSFNNSWIIVEEAQLMTMAELLTITTRIGSDSKMTINGDYRQNIRQPDFKKYVATLESHNVDNVSIVRMNENDIIRSKMVKDLTLVYNKENLW